MISMQTRTPCKLKLKTDNTGTGNDGGSSTMTKGDLNDDADDENSIMCERQEKDG